MVFTGSIGLHHVISKLRQAGYRNDPTNDMYPVDISPLSLKNATELTYRLIEGEKISTLNIQINIAEIAQAVDCIPFYIHHLISKLTFLEAAISQDTITQTIKKCLLDPLNPWKMNHYRDRIDSYYDNAKKNYAFNILDILAVEPSLSFSDLWQRLKLEENAQDKETARTVLILLFQDYYIVQDLENFYSFRYKIVQQYWKILRGL